VALQIVRVKVRGCGEQDHICPARPWYYRSFFSKQLVETLGIGGKTTSLALSTLSSGKEVKSMMVSLEVTAATGRKTRSIELPSVHALQEFPDLDGSIADQRKWLNGLIWKVLSLLVRMS
jgi:hypothetical protein